MAKRISTSRRSATTNVKKSRQTFAAASTEALLKQAPIEDLQDFSARSLLTYGTYVVEQRAIVAYNDGLKPVHRAILWAMYGLHLHNTSSFKKCARVVGETLGLYHPHGDASLYDALVGLVNSPTGLIEGYGDFGDHYCPAGASRYCFIGSTRVMTEYGLVKISDIPRLAADNPKKGYLHRSGEHINIDVNVASLKEDQKATYWVNSGKQETVKVTTNFGNSIQCTPNQPLYTLTSKGYEWKEVQDLVVGDKICIKRGYNDLNIQSGNSLPDFIPTATISWRKVVYPSSYYPQTMTTDLAFILGAIVSEGSKSGSSIEFTNTNKTYFLAYANAFRSVFDKRVKTSQKLHRRLNPKHKLLKSFTIHHTVMIEWFENLGVKFGSYNQVVPEVIFQSSKTEVAAFLRALYEGDGCIRSDRGNRKITYSSASDQLVADVQLLLFNYFGIVSCIYKDRLQSVLVISSLKNLSIFQQEIGFVSVIKSKKLKAAVSELSTYHKGGSCYGMPKDFTHMLRKEYLAKFTKPGCPTVDEFGRPANRGKKGIFNQIPRDSDNFCAHVKKHSPIDKQLWPTLVGLMEDVADNNYCYATITSIEDMPDQWVYDLTVPKTHAFVANGIIAHNTECRISAFSDAILLDPDYLAVTPMVDNYSGDRKMPLYLPAKLPIALLIGNLGIAFGVAASMPSFELSGVAAMTKRALQVSAGESKTPITAKECADTLKFKFKYGGNIRSQKSDIVNFMSTGKGSLYFSPTVERIDTPKLKRYLIKSACPGFETKSSIDKTLEKIANLRGVTLVSDVTDKSGVQYNINLTKTLSGKPLLDLFTSIDKLLLKTDSYDVGLTARSPNAVKFFKTSIPDLLMRWAKWRLQLEKKMLANLALKEKEKLAKLKLIAHAISNLKIVVKALESSDPESYLMTNLGINQEQANYIRDLKFRQLEATDLNTVKAKIKDSIKLVNQYAADYKAPCNRIVSDLDIILNNKKILSNAAKVAKT